MTERWYYEQEGETSGPVPVTELLFLAAEGLLRPDALLWLDGQDRARAVVAQAALDFASLQNPNLPTGAVVAWPEEPAARAVPLPPPAPPPPAPPPPAPPPPKGDDNGIDPETGAIVDEAKYRAWQQRQQRRADEQAGPEVRRDSRKELADWVDRAENRERVLAGDVAALRREPFVEGLFRLCASQGPRAVERLAAYLTFLVENRRRFYRQFGG
jgi:hypothetical protein